MATYIFFLLLLLGGLAWVVLTQPPKKTAAFLVSSGPILLIVAGVILTILRRGVIGLPLIFIGLSWLRRTRPMRPMPANGTRKSTVRSAHLDMELDHDTGEMDGTILSGRHQGRRLSELSEGEIVALYREFSADGDSVALLESYLDRNHPDWRDHDDAQSFDEGEKSSGHGAMSRQEACQILGVTPDASQEEIHEAWRRLIKKVHPDSGGSAFLAAKINTAKEVLLG